MAKSSSMPVGIKPKNKLRRQAAYLSIRKAKESAKRDQRFKRKREEAKAPELREERLARNIPATIDSKRTWDEQIGDEEDVLGLAVDVERLAKKRKLEQEAAERAENGEEEDGDDGVLAMLKKRDQEDAEDEEDEEDERDSMLDSDSEDEEGDFGSGSDSEGERSRSKRKSEPPKRAPSPAASTATNLELSPEFLVRSQASFLTFSQLTSCRNKNSRLCSIRLQNQKFS